MSIEEIKIKNKICDLKLKLKATNDEAIKFAEGELTISEYAGIKEQRKQWRTEINKLEQDLKALGN